MTPDITCRFCAGAPRPHARRSRRRRTSSAPYSWTRQLGRQYAPGDRHESAASTGGMHEASEARAPSWAATPRRMRRSVGRGPRSCVILAWRRLRRLSQCCRVVARQPVRRSEKSGTSLRCPGGTGRPSSELQLINMCGRSSRSALRVACGGRARGRRLGGLARGSGACKGSVGNCRGCWPRLLPIVDCASGHLAFCRSSAT